jgi:hypothetical protein
MFSSLKQETRERLWNAGLRAVPNILAAGTQRPAGPDRSLIGPDAQQAAAAHILTRVPLNAQCKVRAGGADEPITVPVREWDATSLALRTARDGLPSASAPARARAVSADHAERRSVASAIRNGARGMWTGKRVDPWVSMASARPVPPASAGCARPYVNRMPNRA